MSESYRYPPGYALIAAERTRQVEMEGWTPEHDDLAGGPFESYKDAQEFESEDMYATEVDGVWFAQRHAATYESVDR